MIMNGIILVVLDIVTTPCDALETTLAAAACVDAVRIELTTSDDKGGAIPVVFCAAWSAFVAATEAAITAPAGGMTYVSTPINIPPNGLASVHGCLIFAARAGTFRKS